MDGMAATRKPAIEQIFFPKPTKLCPVCGKASYSLSGEHPQCSVLRRDTRGKKRAHRA
jgi:hypothetical protein